MADYYPLLARALDALPDRSPDMRRAVYDRARSALTAQLRTLDPPLSEEDIAAECRSLDAAIARLEGEHGGEAPAPAPAPEPAPALPEPEPALPPPPADDALPEPGPPIALRMPEPDRPRPPPPAEAAAPEAAAEENSAGRQRPRIEVVRPKGGRSRLLRNGIVALVLALVIGAIAVTAWSLRDTPETLQSRLGEPAAERPPENQDSKFADRVGGERAPAAPAPAPAARGGNEIAVAQRATRFEETGAQGSQPRAIPAQVVWRLDAVNAGQGQPLQTVVRAEVEAQEAGLSLSLVIRRNTDAALPASHVIELTFTPTDPARAVRDVGLLQFKDDESGRGSPVSGLPVPVRENLFLIGLSNLKGDVERNTDLLLRRNWIDLPLRYASNTRAILTFEKGSAGERVMREAFAQWQ